MDIYTTIQKRTIERARDRAAAELNAIIGDHSMAHIYALVDEIRELENILAEHEERERWRSEQH